MGQSAVKNPRKIFSQAGADPALNNRVTNLENNEYKITYYEIVSGTSGSLTIPTNSTINSNEFGLSGNAILSKIDGSNKPTYESPKTVGGVVVTATLNPTTGAWTSSDTYADATVALIYSIKIKSIYYSNLNYDRIIESVALAVTKTSDLINDGDDGNKFISLNDLPSNLILYATTAASDIPTYVKLVSSITDSSYNTVAVNVSTGSITTTNQLISSLVTSPNIIIGNPGVFNITTIGNITRTSGSGQAEFYFQVYKRDSAGTETLITTSDNTLPVLNTGYSEFSATGLWNDGIFVNTDRIVLKFYASRISGGSDPSYDFQFGGTAPVRTLVPLPLTVVPVLKLDNLQDVDATTPNNNDVLTYDSALSLWKNKQSSLEIMYLDTIDSATLTGTTVQTLISTYQFNANDYLVGDVIRFYLRGRKIGTNSSITLRIYYNTINSLSGATVLHSLSISNTQLSFSSHKNGVIKSASATEFYPSGIANDEALNATTASSNINIDYTAIGYFIIALVNASVADSTTISLFEVQRKR